MANNNYRRYFMLKEYWLTNAGMQTVVMAVTVALGCFLVDPAMAASTGALIQPPGTAGCVSEDGTGVAVPTLGR